MRTIRLLALLMILLLSLGSIAIAQGKERENKKNKNTEMETVQLFNGKDLNNWIFQLKDPAIDPAKVFFVQKGILHITGDPFGYMRTKESYSDYKLHVEWRWPVVATNSGVFVHGQQPDAIWLKCIECNLMAGSAGDFVCMNGAEMDQHTDKSSIMVKKLAPSSEKPAGKWNIMEVICNENTIEVFVNGVLQNKGTNVSLNQGSICLQSEGKEIEFRKVFLTKLKK
jgi:hypothetical protein